MPITDPTDLGAYVWLDPATGLVPDTSWANQGSLGGTFAKIGANGPVVGGSFNTRDLISIGGNRASQLILGAPLPQPFEIHIAVSIGNFGLLANRTLLDGLSAADRCAVGWTPGASTFQGRPKIHGGTLLTMPDDNRLAERFQLLGGIFDGVNSQCMLAGVKMGLTGSDAGAHAVNGFTLGSAWDGSEPAQHSVGHIVISPVLDVLQRLDLIEWYQSEYNNPDIAPVRFGILLVHDDPTSQRANMIRFAIEKRGHVVDIVASSDLATANWGAYPLIVYAGAYADRAVNGPIMQAALAAGVKVECFTYEKGMTGSGITDTVACQLRLVSSVDTRASFNYPGGLQLVAGHPVSDWYPVALPTNFTAHQTGTAGGLPSAASTVAGLQLDGFGNKVLQVIEKGDPDIDSNPVGARCVLNSYGHGDASDPFYFTPSATTNPDLGGGEQLFQHEIDWMLDTIEPPLLTQVGTLLRIKRPRLGEIIDPLAGDVVFEWTDRAGKTATIETTPDMAASPAVWTARGSTGLGVTTLAVDMSNAATFPRGIYWGMRVVWSDGVIWQGWPFKLLEGAVAVGVATRVTKPGEEHFFIPWDAVQTPGGGGALHTHLWSSAKPWWPHNYEGLAAKVLQGAEVSSVAVPPGLPTGFKHYQISAYVRMGRINSPVIGQSTYYRSAEGQGGAVALYADGVVGSSTGIVFGIFNSNIFPFGPCPGEGLAGTVWYSVGARSTPGAPPGGNVASGFVPSQQWHAVPSPCRIDHGLVPILLTVIQRTPTRARILSSLTGKDSSPFWIVDTETDFVFADAGDMAGWALFKVFGNQDEGGFRDMYSLSVSAYNEVTPGGDSEGGGGGGILPPSAACPPIGLDTPVRLYMGSSDGGVLEYGSSELDDGQDIIGVLRPNEIGMGGIGGSAEYRTLYLALTYSGDVVLTFTPILDGERLNAETVTLLLNGPGTRITERLEFPLSRLMGGRRSSLRGTWFTCAINVIDVCSQGLILEGAEVEILPLREQLNQQPYTAEVGQLEPTMLPLSLFLGGGGSLFEGGRGFLDGTAAVAARLTTNEIAPAGVGGDTMFSAAYLAVEHANELPVTLRVTPIVDGVRQRARLLTLPATRPRVTQNLTGVLALPALTATGSFSPFVPANFSGVLVLPALTVSGVLNPAAAGTGSAGGLGGMTLGSGSLGG